MRFFAWTHAKRLSLPAIKSYHVSAYLAELLTKHATPTVKQHLASLRMLFDWLNLKGVRNEWHSVVNLCPSRSFWFFCSG